MQDLKRKIACGFYSRPSLGIPESGLRRSLSPGVRRQMAEAQAWLRWEGRSIALLSTHSSYQQAFLQPQKLEPQNLRSSDAHAVKVLSVTWDL